MAASIKAGFYTIGLAGGVETMSSNPMAWAGGVNSKLDQNQQAADCLLPMGAAISRSASFVGKGGCVCAKLYETVTIF